MKKKNSHYDPPPPVLNYKKKEPTKRRMQPINPNKKRRISKEDSNSKTLNWWENDNIGQTFKSSSSDSDGLSDLGETSAFESLNLDDPPQFDEHEEDHSVKQSFLVPTEMMPQLNPEDLELDLGKSSSAQQSDKENDSSEELDLGESSTSISSSFKQNKKEENKMNHLLYKKKELEKEFDTKPKKIKARRLSISDIEGLDEYKPNGDPLINLEMKSYLIWTYGVLVMTLIIFCLEFAQQGGIAPFAQNPLIGPSEETATLMGAKNTDNILHGDLWRFLTANFINMNLLQFILSVILVLSCRKVEADSGFIRALFVFLLCGIYGYVLSAMCVPWVISGGLSGAFFGYVGLIICDILSSWRMDKKSKFSTLMCILIISIIHLIFGFTPFMDNFPHYGGFVMGFLTALMLLPNLNFDSWEKKCHGISAFLAFPIVSVICTITLVFVYRGTTNRNYLCMWCRYLTCINIAGWCPDIESNSQNIIYADQ